MGFVPFSARDETLNLLLETILATVDAHSEATAASEPALTPILVQTWGENIGDPTITQVAVGETVILMAPPVLSILKHLIKVQGGATK